MLPNTAREDKALREEVIRKACLEFGYTLAATVRKGGLNYSTVSKIIKGKRWKG